VDQQPVTYRVVGVRIDGAQETISTSNTRDMAERILKLIRSDGSRFTEMRIESSQRKRRGRPKKVQGGGQEAANGACRK
jgi:hypothetical protein